MLAVPESLGDALVAVMHHAPHEQREEAHDECECECLRREPN